MKVKTVKLPAAQLVMSEEQAYLLYQWLLQHHSDAPAIVFILKTELGCWLKKQGFSIAPDKDLNDMIMVHKR